MMRQYELVERVTKYDPDADEDLLNRAYVYAMKAHGNQKRASGEAYFNHPLEVAAILTNLYAAISRTQTRIVQQPGQQPTAAEPPPAIAICRVPPAHWRPRVPRSVRSTACTPPTTRST